MFSLILVLRCNRTVLASGSNVARPACPYRRRDRVPATVAEPALKRGRTSCFRLNIPAGRFDLSRLTRHRTGWWFSVTKRPCFSGALAALESVPRLVSQEQNLPATQIPKQEPDSQFRRPLLFDANANKLAASAITAELGRGAVIATSDPGALTVIGGGIHYLPKPVPNPAAGFLNSRCPKCHRVTSHLTLRTSSMMSCNWDDCGHRWMPSDGVPLKGQLDPKVYRQTDRHTP